MPNIHYWEALKWRTPKSLLSSSQPRLIRFRSGVVAWSLVDWWQAGAHSRPQVNEGTTRSNHTENQSTVSSSPCPANHSPHPTLDSSFSLCRTQRFHTCPSADYRHGTSINATKPMKPFESPGKDPKATPRSAVLFLPSPPSVHKAVRKC